MNQPSKFDLIYDRLCNSTGSVLSIYTLDFFIRVTPERLEESKTYTLIYTEQNVGIKEKIHRISVYKSTTDIYFYIETRQDQHQGKLLFDSNKINIKDLDLLIMNLRNQTKL
jgi:coproporphyrinogen III oxidase